MAFTRPAVGERKSISVCRAGQSTGGVQAGSFCREQCHARHAALHEVYRPSGRGDWSRAGTCGRIPAAGGDASRPAAHCSPAIGPPINEPLRATRPAGGGSSVGAQTTTQTAIARPSSRRSDIDLTRRRRPSGPVRRRTSLPRRHSQGRPPPRHPPGARRCSAPQTLCWVWW